jgi:magnesium chelatase family protein
VQRYRSRVSGPLLDRIDIHVEVRAVGFQSLADRAAGEPSQALRERVDRARARQLERFAGKLYCNAQMGSREVRQHAVPDAAGERLLEQAMQALGLSARAYARVLKVARTIADLDGAAAVGSAHVAEAVQYRSLDRNLH